MNETLHVWLTDPQVIAYLRAGKADGRGSMKRQVEEAVHLQLIGQELTRMGAETPETGRERVWAKIARALG